jgi:hypothetical protein
MAVLSRLYRKNLNGIIITLIFHILVFASLFLAQFKIKEENKEPEILIDFPIQTLEPVLPINKNQGGAEKKRFSDQLRTNTASSKTALQQNKSFDEQYQKELERAQNLVKEVSEQLQKEIPAIENLKMPDAPKVNPDEMKDKLYSGESNIEYFLENRYHIKLPIPVYLAEGGGKVKVIIIVDRLGNVVKADPALDATLSDQILSYAKTAALRTKFNPNPDSPALQTGYIIYNFIPQR